MYGAVGYPNKVAKTVIVGKKADLVCRLLYILTYFIRCSEVHENRETREEVVMEYKEVATNCGYDFIQTTESGYNTSQDVTDSEDSDRQTHHLESSLETVEETSESLASPVESGTFDMERRSTLTSDNKTDASTPDDGERTPVAISPESLIKCNEGGLVIEAKSEFIAPVGKAPLEHEQTIEGASLERKRDLMLPINQLCAGDSNAPIVKCKEDVVVERKLEAGVPVGRAAPSNLVLSIDQSSDSREPIIRCKDNVVVERKLVAEIPVGHSAPNNFVRSDTIDCQEPLIKCKDSVDTISHPRCESVALVGRANVDGEIHCKGNAILEAKKECVSHVGRSSHMSAQTLGSAIVRTDDNENKLVDQFSNPKTKSVNTKCNDPIDNTNHVCENKTTKACESLSLKLASKQCNATQLVNNNLESNGRKSPVPESGGRRSPGIKEAHDLYVNSNTKSGVTSVLNQMEKASFLRSLSSSSSTSSVFSSDLDYSSGLWMGVNKGSEVIADSRPSREQYTRGISTTSVFSTTSSTHSYETDGTLTPDHEELPLAL